MDLYGLIGKSLSHSFSQDLFRKKFQEENIEADYLLFELNQIGEIKEVMKANPNLKGLNVTIPYKEEIIPYLDQLTTEAEAVGAVNAVRVSPGGLMGTNTDVFGFQYALQELVPNPKPTKAIVLGRGGASKAVTYVLTQLDWIESVSVFNRNGNHNQIKSFQDLTDEVIAAHQLIINATPLGTHPRVDEFPPLPYSAISKEHLLFDLVYNPSETAFMRKGREKGALVSNGMRMLELQAKAAWDFWQERVSK